MRFGNVTRTAALGLVAAPLVLTGCSGLDGNPTAQGGAPQTSSSAPMQRPTTRPPTVEPSTAPDPTDPDPTDPDPTAPDPTDPVPVTGPRQTTPPTSNTAADRPGSGHGYCFDLNSQLSQNAIASLGTDNNGGAWQPVGASEHPLSDGCGLDWMLVNGSGFNDATYTSRVLLFADGEFLGTVEPHEFSYTSIAGGTLNSVTVRYRWLRDDDPFCCPQGGPTTVTVTLSGGELTRSGQFPPH